MIAIDFINIQEILIDADDVLKWTYKAERSPYVLLYDHIEVIDVSLDKARVNVELAKLDDPEHYNPRKIAFVEFLYERSKDRTIIIDTITKTAQEKIKLHDTK